MSEKIYIVGDSFSAMTNFPEISTYSEFINQDNLHSAGKTVYACQGIDEDKLLKLKEYNLNIVEKITKRVGTEIVHKHKKANVLITEPVKHSDTTYEAFLIINENCAEMSDHVTGKHLQGLLLIEAARQMFMAVTELYDLSEEQRGSYSYVLSNLDISFSAFLFPFDVSIKLEVLDKNWNKTAINKSVVIKFQQSGITGCKIKASGMGIPTKVLKYMEEVKADDMHKTTAYA